MKFRRILAAAVSAATAAVMLASSASASITIMGKAPYLTVTSQSWGISLDSAYNIDYEKLTSLEFIVSITDITAYNQEKSSGYYFVEETPAQTTAAVTTAETTTTTVAEETTTAATEATTAATTAATTTAAVTTAATTAETTTTTTTAEETTTTAATTTASAITETPAVTTEEASAMAEPSLANRPKFVDFEGQISIGGAEWHGFRFQGLSNTAGSTTTAAVSYLGAGRYKISANLTPFTIKKPNYAVVVKIEEWANKSSKYTMTVEGMTLYGANGSVVANFDSKGNGTVYTSSFASTTTTQTTTTAVTSEAATETTTTAATTTEATTTTTTAEVTATTEAPETAAEAPDADEPEPPADDAAEAVAEDEPAAITTAPETAGITLATLKPATATPLADLSSRDASLVVVGVISLLVIIAVVIVFMMYIKGKKK